MNYQHDLIFYHTITPLHVGCGQDVGVVDLPVIRERTTGYPFIPGSGIRGSIRDRFEQNEEQKPDERLTSLLFGPTVEEGGEEESRHAGCVAIHDARILLFPVRSDVKVFLWITCPAVLRRFTRDLQVFTQDLKDLSLDLKTAPADEELFGSFGQGKAIYLEEFSYTCKGGNDATALKTWAEKLGPELEFADLASSLAIVSDSSFYHFVNHATMVIQHNRLTSAKTVKEGALFSVEAVPPETVFYGFFGGTGSRRQTDEEKGEKRLEPKEVLEKLRYGLVTSKNGIPTGYLNLGGDESTGLGVTKILWATEVTS